MASDLTTPTLCARRQFLTFPGSKIFQESKACRGSKASRIGLVFALGNNRRIGVATTQLTKQLADYFGVTDGKGVLVTSVSEGSPAAKAGIKAGDVITVVDGEKIEGSGDLSRAINKQKDGDLTVTIMRDKSPRTIKGHTGEDAKSADTTRNRRDSTSDSSQDARFDFAGY